MKKFLFGLILGFILGIVGCVLAIKNVNSLSESMKADVHINEQVLKEKLVTCSELTTAKYVIDGQIERTEQYDLLKSLGINHGIKSFTVKYQATINLAIDLAKADIKVDSVNNLVTLKLPNAEVQSLSVPSESLEITSEKKSLINWENKNDMIEALHDCEEHAKKNCDMDKYVKQANDEAVVCLQSLLAPMMENADGSKPYQVKITVGDQAVETPAVETPAAK